MTPNNLPTDQEFLETLAQKHTRLLPKKIRERQEKYAIDSVDKLIAKGVIDRKDKQLHIDINLDLLNPAKLFQGDSMQSVRAAALSHIATQRPEYETIPVGVLFVPELNAFAIKTPGGGSAIALNAGVWLHLQIAFFCLLAMVFRNTPHEIGGHHTNHTYLINLFNIVDAIKRSAIILMTTTGEHSIEDCVGLSGKPEPMVVQHMHSALTFILLHEYGHIYHKHLDKRLTRKMAFGDDSLDIYLTSHKQEYEADAFAIRKLLREGEEHLYQNVFYVVSIAMLFLFLDLCEDTNDSEPLGTHPASRKRLERLCAECKNICDTRTWLYIEDGINNVHEVFERIQAARKENA